MRLHTNCTSAPPNFCGENRPQRVWGRDDIGNYAGCYLRFRESVALSDEVRALVAAQGLALILALILALSFVLQGVARHHE